MTRSLLVGFAFLWLSSTGMGAGARADVAILNASYDPTREFYEDFNAAFIEHWKATAGEPPTWRMARDATLRAIEAKGRYGWRTSSGCTGKVWLRMRCSDSRRC